MHNEPAKAVLERFYTAEAAYIAAGGADERVSAALDACLDPDVVLHQAPGLPFTGTGTWRGPDGIRAFLDVFSGIWESMELLEHQQLTDNETVAVLIVARFRSRATGRSVDARLTQVNRLRAGRVVEFRPFYWDPAAIVEVCTPQDSNTPSSSAL